MTAGPTPAIHAAVLHGILRHVPCRSAGAYATAERTDQGPGLSAACAAAPRCACGAAAAARSPAAWCCSSARSVANAGARPPGASHACGCPRRHGRRPDSMPTSRLDEPATSSRRSLWPRTRTGAGRPRRPSTAAVISGLAANGIPTVALNAYRVAAARLANADPGCGIDWALLAGIGREESDHGQFAGAVLHADGVSTPRIIGIPLNGHGTALIRDTDHGALDGDTVYDHAVGPMQFIPSTWALYGTDANGDGVADPFNINDAALTAARYLCAAGGDLRTPRGPGRGRAGLQRLRPVPRPGARAGRRLPPRNLGQRHAGRQRHRRRCRR